MKEINLISLTQASKGLSRSLLESYYKQFNVFPKGNELNDLELLIGQLQKVSSNIQVLDRYFFGYTIPQISKEFDLLRFGTDSVVNIELKSKNTGAKIFKQMVKNHYYLSFLNKKIYNYTYVSDENQLYSLDEDQKLCTVNFNELFKTLTSQNSFEVYNIDKLFNPSNYLVSPLNSTDKFIEGKYFLTGHQEEIKAECIKKLDLKGVTFLSICGKAGTGKTLLTFDIAKEYINKKDKVLIIHCGLLNAGHNELKETYGWEITAIKNHQSYNLSNYSLVIIDECQRIYPSQLELIIAQIKVHKINCIFSYDKQQCLRQWEINNNISEVILNTTSAILFELTEKIRTNKEIASFIIALFDNSKNVEKLNRDNIELSYFQTTQDATKYINLLGEYGWKIINYTQSNMHKYPYDEYIIFNEDNAHGVIGQEFDKVVAVIDHCYYYNKKDLDIRYYKNTPYYHPVKMLFQIMTRTRIKLHVIIINNEEIMERCFSILKPN